METLTPNNPPFPQLKAWFAGHPQVTACGQFDTEAQRMPELKFTLPGDVAGRVIVATDNWLTGAGAEYLAKDFIALSHINTQADPLLVLFPDEWFGAHESEVKADDLPTIVKTVHTLNYGRVYTYRLIDGIAHLYTLHLEYVSQSKRLIFRGGEITYEFGFFPHVNRTAAAYNPALKGDFYCLMFDEAIYWKPSHRPRPDSETACRNWKTEREADQKHKDAEAESKKRAQEEYRQQQRARNQREEDNWRRAFEDFEEFLRQAAEEARRDWQAAQTTPSPTGRFAEAELYADNEAYFQRRYKVSITLTRARAVLGYTPGMSLDDLKATFRLKATELHPDKGGSVVAFQELNEAYQLFQKLMSD